MNPRCCRILYIEEEASNVRSITVENDTSPEPGQFIMVWLPHPKAGEEDVCDEIPMSISDYSPGKMTFTVKGVGPTTREMLRLEVGDCIGISGPFGRGFSLRGNVPLLIGGGIGIAPLLFLARRLHETGTRDVTAILGARTLRELPLVEKMSRYAEIMITTEDGSAGMKGMVIDALSRLEEVDYVYACGPEAMLLAIYRFCEDMGIEAQFSMERIMRCGRGLCGSCSIRGWRVCVEGPVFDWKRLVSIYG